MSAQMCLLTWFPTTPLAACVFTEMTIIISVIFCWYRKPAAPQRQYQRLMLVRHFCRQTQSPTARQPHKPIRPTMRQTRSQFLRPKRTARRTNRSRPTRS